MIPKQEFMFKGAIVKALGEKATITKMEENNIDGTDYVYRIWARKEGKKFTLPYHPKDIEELKV